MIDDAQTGNDKLTSEIARDRCKEGSSRYGATRHPGATARSGEGFSPKVSPITYRTSVLHTSLQSYPPHVGKHRNRVATADRDPMGRGSDRTGFEGVDRGGTGTGTMPCESELGYRNAQRDSPFVYNLQSVSRLVPPHRYPPLHYRTVYPTWAPMSFRIPYL